MSKTKSAVLEIAHVLFLDLVGYSKLPMVEARQLLGELQENVRGMAELAKAHQKGRLLVVPTGDGMSGSDGRPPARHRFLHPLCIVRLG